MGNLIPISAVVVAITYSTLLVIGVQDWRDRRVGNLAIVVLLACASLHWYAAHPEPAVIGFSLAVALAIIVPGTAFGVFGAGDTKLLASLALLWPAETLLFVFSLGVLGLVVGSFLADTAVKLFRPAYLVGDAQHHPITLMQQFRLRGLPLGTAVAVGAVGALVIML